MVEVYNIVGSNQLIVPYRGDLQSTAALVGLAHQRAPVGQIIYLGQPTLEAMNSISKLNRWLSEHGLPKIQIFPDVKSECRPMIHLHSRNILQDLNWGHDECVAALKLTGLFQI